MNIILNNTAESFTENELTVAELLKLKNFIFKMLVIKINGILVRKENYETTVIKNGDNVMVMHLVSGG
jgi:sulfur carrier protein